MNCMVQYIISAPPSVPGKIRPIALQDPSLLTLSPPSHSPTLKNHTSPAQPLHRRRTAGMPYPPDALETRVAAETLETPPSPRFSRQHTQHVCRSACKHPAYSTSDFAASWRHHDELFCCGKMATP